MRSSVKRRRRPTHAPVASGQRDWRGVEICARCDSLWTDAVHRLPAVSTQVSALTARILGERPD